jgi:hypothetical protein
VRPESSLNADKNGSKVYSFTITIASSYSYYIHAYILDCRSESRDNLGSFPRLLARTITNSIVSRVFSTSTKVRHPTLQDRLSSEFDVG